MVYIALGLEAPLRLLIPEPLIDYLKDMDAGNPTRPKMASLRIISNLLCFLNCS